MCFPSVLLILTASSISSLVETSCIYIVFSILGSFKFSCILFTISSDVPSISIDFILSFFILFLILSCSFSVEKRAAFTVCTFVFAIFADTPSITLLPFIKSPSSIIVSILLSYAIFCAL